VLPFADVNADAGHHLHLGKRVEAFEEERAEAGREGGEPDEGELA
jgi:hypothetical protein